MISERKIAANRRNAKKSTGPRTAVGKLQASLNALRHGLAGVRHHNPMMARKVASMAEAICGRSQDPLLYEQALRIVENESVLRDIREQRISVIERMRDSTAVPLSKPNHALVVAKMRVKARVQEMIRASKELRAIEKEVFSITDPVERERWYEQPVEQPPPPPIEARDEGAALCAAMQDLDRLDRYERRAFARQKRAVRKFIEIKSGLPDRARFHPDLGRLELSQPLSDRPPNGYAASIWQNEATHTSGGLQEL